MTIRRRRRGAEKGVTENIVVSPHAIFWNSASCFFREVFHLHSRYMNSTPQLARRLIRSPRFDNQAIRSPTGRAATSNDAPECVHREGDDENIEEEGED